MKDLNRHSVCKKLHCKKRAIWVKRDPIYGIDYCFSEGTRGRDGRKITITQYCVDHLPEESQEYYRTEYCFSVNCNKKGKHKVIQENKMIRRYCKIHWEPEFETVVIEEPKKSCSTNDSSKNCDLELPKKNKRKNNSIIGDVNKCQKNDYFNELLKMCSCFAEV